MTPLTITNPLPMIAGDPRIVGGAVKMIQAKAQNLPDSEQQRASGCAAYVWSRHRAKIKTMVRRLDSADA